MSISLVCSFCGEVTPSDSKFCINCGKPLPSREKTIESNGKKEKMFQKILNLMRNKIVCILIIFIMAGCGIGGYHLANDQLFTIKNRGELIELTEEMIDLIDSSRYLGSSYSYQKDLEEYKLERTIAIGKLIGGYGISLISSIVIIFTGYKLFITIKKEKEINVL